MYKMQVVTSRFYCNICEYRCDRKWCWDQHIRTVKHQAATVCTDMPHIGNKEHATLVCGCGKKYMDRTGLWRHKKVCVSESKDTKTDAKAEVESPKDDVSDKQLIMMLIKQNSELMEMLKNGTVNNNTTNNINTNTNCNNKAFNLNVFLNETCKNAMNISEFMDSIQVQLKDLERFGEVGYVEGISNIITNNLKQMDITERPVHCTDQKRETIYIKDDNKWEKEDDNKTRLRRLIKRVETKNFKLLPAYREKYPGCQQSDSKHSNKYNKMMVEVTGGAGDNDLEKQDKIIRNISKNVFVDK